MNNIETTVPETAGAAPGGHEVTREPERYAVPPVDIFESGDLLVVLADLPGVTKEGLSIQVEKGVLTIEGRVDRDTAGPILRREFALMSFFRQFRITEAVNSDKIRAALKNGVLRIELPKAEAAKPRRIPVET